MTKKPENIILKSLLRKPIIAILLTLLISLVAYGFVGKAVETILVYRETTRLEKYYRSIGYIEQTNPENEQNPFQAGAEFIRQSPDLAFDDLRIQTAGFMQDYYNTDFHKGTMDVGKTLYSEPSLWYGEGVNNLEYWFYGKLIHFSKEYESDPKLKKIQIFSGYQLIFQAEEVLAGYPERIKENHNYVVWIPVRYTENIEEMTPYLETMEVGSSYLIRGWSHPSFNFSVVGLPISVENQYETMNLKPLDGKNLWFISVEDNQRIDLALPEIEALRLEIDRLNQNLRSILLVGTADMSAMPEMQLDAKHNYLVDGRWLNHDDNLTSGKVIVISKNLADTRGLSVGDDLTVTMIALRDPYVSYIRSAEDIANWKNYPSKKLTYEIVGIYSNAWMDSSQVFKNIFTQSYVPLSTIPQEFAFPAYWSGLKDPNVGYSFVLKDPRFQANFIETYASELESMGFKLSFSDNEGEKFVAGIDPLRKSNLISFSLYTIALIFAVFLSIFIYSRQQRKNYAILRALGVTKINSGRQFVQPLLVLGIVGSTLGSIISWHYAHKKAGESLSQLPLPSGVFPELTLNIWIGISLWLFILLILFVGTLVSSKRLSKTPVLALLQDNSTRVKTPAQTEQSFEKEITPSQTKKIKRSTNKLSRKKVSNNQVAALRNFSRLALRRSPLKNLLITSVAAALLLSLGWFQRLIKANQEEINSLYESTRVQIDIVPKSDESFNAIPRKLVEDIQDTQFISSSNLSHILKFKSSFNENTGSFDGFPPYPILALNNFEPKSIKRLDGYEITWAPGYSSEVFSESGSLEEEERNGIPVIVPVEIMREQGWGLGDSFSAELEKIPVQIPFKIVGTSTGGIAELRSIIRNSAGKMFAFDFRYMITNLASIEQYYPNHSGYTDAILYSEPKMNYRLSDLKTIVSQLLGDSGNKTINVIFWDEELLAVIHPLEKNFSLMERLYPIAVILAGVLGGVLSLLLLLYQEKETALLRMLGVEKHRITRMQIGQFLLLTVSGLVVGTIILIILPGIATLQWSIGIVALIYLVGTLLGTLVGSVWVTNKKPMELLQVKE